MSIGLPRGVQDILPDEIPFWHLIENIARSLFEKYNYEEIRTPIFEFTELFVKGTGETTDIVMKEMYTFQDKKGRSLTLRPEGTPGVIRAYLMNKIYTTKPIWKVYYIGPMFRYERPQSGRYRQFHQLGVEVLGRKDPYIDFEVISLAVEILKSLKLENLEIEINSLGCLKCRPAYREALKNYFYQYKDLLSPIDQERLERNPLRILDSKDEKIIPLKENAPQPLDFLCNDCKDHFDKVLRYLQEASLNFKISPKLVRGLDYYTRTVFEITTTSLGAQNAVVGGGRYDNLVETYGGPSTPGLGFALGMERLILLIKQQDKIKIEKPSLFFLAIENEKYIKKAVEISKILRINHRVEIGSPNEPLRTQLKWADKLNSDYVIFINQMIEKDILRIKNFKTGEEKEIRIENLKEL
ncbi:MULTISPECIES: histidine--tRNA ligase [Dictyoglomus]|uniref:Histidine--tRNA ligase n=1 Tax=Dictyoglomus turgidum (strain DSM 6724 / Z-1310) TaxID=515635 RepID=SYH_DICTD|nr:MULTISPECIES: histidine--tRNA ligase [Dictyoglomus]B8E1C1.1 RecName: Full=Histidine--tRNA ligase; AltName: Full=Histidyl-tRNA synthetase; Short=HisRS [Dictyoglomus turgidum DSM 6724]ACK42249.1 histidyl-tRNA synthetase [Dictyoglomus turgidum DSM 6724]HBU32480.1 histidine--tRNA ligase [Dictyoglomus sp.]